MERWLPLALTLAKLGTPVRVAPSSRNVFRGVLLDIFALACAVATTALALAAIGLALAPIAGAAGALGVDAGLVAAMGLSTLVWTRAAATKPPSTPIEFAFESPLVQIATLLKRNKGLSIVAGLFLGVLVGGR